jgi:type III restriction enzyme
LNEKKENDYSYVNSLDDLDVKEKDFKYEVFSFKGKVTQALTDSGYDNLNIKKEPKTIALQEIEKHIIYNALTRKEFFKFEILKKYFPKLNSLKDFVENKEYLSDIKIVFWATKEEISNLPNNLKFFAVLKVLDEIEAKLKGNLLNYKGTKEFFPKKISEIFEDKKIKIELGTERADGQEEFLKDKEWYPFNANFGTSEEKACVLLINRLVEENFKQKYKEIYLIRNELHFKIYNFDDGMPFAPDFVLFMKTLKGEQITYQIFIEPKGKHLEKIDEWKEKFLLKIKEQFSSKGLLKFIETSKYKIIGVPFYNQSNENEFKDELLTSLD